MYATASMWLHLLYQTEYLERCLPLCAAREKAKV